MTSYRTAQGKIIDMSKLASTHENIRAVGNMNVNARGDTLDSNNNVIEEGGERVNRMYKNTMQASGTVPRRRTASPIQADLVPDEVPAEPETDLPTPPTVKSEATAPTAVTKPPVVEHEPEWTDEEIELDFDDEEPFGKEAPAPAVEPPAKPVVAPVAKESATPAPKKK